MTGLQHSVSEAYEIVAQIPMTGLLHSVSEAYEIVAPLTGLLLCIDWTAPGIRNRCSNHCLHLVSEAYEIGASFTGLYSVV